MSAAAPPSPSPEPTALERWFPVVLFVAVACFALWNLSRHWNASVFDRHEYRQIQTLLSAQGIRDDGAALAYPLPLFGPPWSAPMEFPLYQTLVGWTARWTGCSLECSGRFWSVFALIALLPAVWGLLREYAWPARLRWFVLSAILATPVTLFYSRTVLIESTSVALSAWFLFAYTRAVRVSCWGACGGAVFFGTLAAIVKVTTFVPVAAFAVALAALEMRRRRSPTEAGSGSALSHRWVRWGAIALLPFAVSLIVAQAWVGFGDAVKRASPFSEFLVSANLSAWNFGALGLRATAAYWNQLYFTTAGHVLAEPALWLAGVALVLTTPLARRLALGLAAAFLVGPLVFANLYFVHDYYYHATAPLLAAAVGILLGGVWSRGRAWQPAAVALGLAVLGAQVVSFNRSYGTALRATPPGPPEIAELVRTCTAKDDVVVIGGWDWNATIPYYAERRAVLPRGREEDVAALDSVATAIGVSKVNAIVWRRPSEPVAAVRAWWRDRLGVLDSPAARDGEFDLYVRPDLLPRLAAAFSARKFSRAVQLLEPVARPWDAELKEAAWSDDGVPGPAWPAPYKTRSFHGCGEYDAGGGERRIIAHAVTELFIKPPAGARRIVAEFRMVPNAYERANPGDGAEIAIFEQHAGGARRRLFSRSLNPATQPSDRGDQRVELTDFGPLTGDLVFAVTPGAAGRADFDWCDWKLIRVE